MREIELPPITEEEVEDNDSHPKSTSSIKHKTFDFYDEVSPT